MNGQGRKTMEKSKRWMRWMETRIIDGRYDLKEILLIPSISELLDKYGEEFSRLTIEPNLSATWLHFSDRLETMYETVLQAGISRMKFGWERNMR